MKSLTHQARTLITKKQELETIDSRILQLQQQLKLQESNNHIVEFKVNKILETKKNAYLDMSDLNRRVENFNLENQNKTNKIRFQKQLQKDEVERKKNLLEFEKKLQQELIKEKSVLFQIQFQNSKDEQLQQKQLQYQKMQQEKFKLKQELELKRIEKIEHVRNNQMQQRAERQIQFDRQNQDYQTKLNEEQELQKKLSFSQLRYLALKEDLDMAQKITVRDYSSSTIQQGFSKQILDKSQLKKDIITSPYAQIPSILNQKDIKKVNVLSSLLKPSYKEQQQSAERLMQKGQKSTKITQQLSDRTYTHTKDNLSKFETDTSQTQKNQFHFSKEKVTRSQSKSADSQYENQQNQAEPDKKQDESNKNEKKQDKSNKNESQEKIVDNEEQEEQEEYGEEEFEKENNQKQQIEQNEEEEYPSDKEQE